MSDASPWSAPVRLSEAVRGPSTRTLSADPDARARIAQTLQLDALSAFSGEVSMRPWLDGVDIRAAWRADVTRTCGLSLEPFEQPLAGRFAIRVVPAGSPNAPSPEAVFSVDLESDDPPDVAEGETIDLGAYLVEHLALELDPFPRKPGTTFEAPEGPPEPSPFAALASLKPGGG